MSIHPTSIIGPDVELADDVVIGPFCVLRGKVKIGPETTLLSHVAIGCDDGVVEIGRGNQFYPGSVIGLPPQDHKYKGEATQVVIGDGNTIRECVTINLGTVPGGGVTRLGDHNLIMAYCHIAHDCHFGSHIDAASSCNFGGHVIVGDHVKIGGMVGVVQFCRIGRFAYVGGASAINKDIIPYSIAQGNWAISRATNLVGLERAGYSAEARQQIAKAVKLLLRGVETIDQLLATIEREFPVSEEVQHLIEFVRRSQKGIAR